MAGAEGDGAKGAGVEWTQYSRGQVEGQKLRHCCLVTFPLALHNFVGFDE